MENPLIPLAAYVGAPNLSPSPQNLLGTDSQGRDVFHLTVWGGQASLAVGFGAGLLTVFIATLIGLVAGYFRGRVDDLLTLLMNLFLVIPGLPLLILPQGADQYVIGDLVLAAGAGLRLVLGDVNPSSVRASVLALLNEPA